MGDVLISLIILAFAAYRLTRLLVIDALFEGSREKFHGFLANQANKKGKMEVVWDKTYVLTSCTWCTGAWIALLIYSLYAYEYPWDFSRIDWIQWSAVAGLQGLLHTWELDEE